MRSFCTCGRLASAFAHAFAARSRVLLTLDAAERPLNVVRGVYCVTNLITVEPQAKLAADLGDRVDEALNRMADLDARSIGVAASNGTVHLQGSVRTFAERRIAEHAAAAAPGVREVSNELVVTP